MLAPPPPDQQVPDLGTYSAGSFTRGRPALVELAWIVVQTIFVSSALPGSTHRRFLLRLFGASIGAKVVLKPGIRVKFPWRLTIGDHSWIGEQVWIDNLADVRIGADCCVSQGAYLCTGSHDWSRPGFDLITAPITLEPGAWVAARASVGPGVTIGRGAVLGLGSTATRDLNPWTVYAGIPAAAVRTRTITSQN
ncbi:WcaF family extracellular polysaccharide biosynthesis acetyltransferase [Sphingomonas sp. AOB5]|uniref:WcaF family extracellular polysaccharide biosynthesis acetyltransferase n=1 Tax=Sphingomonas sp. AOB5 TaxID=3034017 RepID=UPI0023F97DD1|nr:WcaF family extracellular polysaccharide biosynthesis acetyltransferase [Sphingomonas sp. AOB5]MDF7775443.1 WcaF family extracellular polysaccharide biosynthesis acetyltransferase [Sphingomonas sp. AOB5]